MHSRAELRFGRSSSRFNMLRISGYFSVDLQAWPSFSIVFRYTVSGCVAMAGKGKGSPFLYKIRKAIRVRHYSIRTEHAYVGWARRFILFHGKQHPERVGESDVAAFLTDLAVRQNVAASTQNQALNALVFMYKHVIGRSSQTLPRPSKELPAFSGQSIL